MGLPVERYDGDDGFESYSVLEKKSLNFLDAVANSNKFYTIELHENNGHYRIFTDYGRLGKSSKKEVRTTDNLLVAQREFASILNSKLRKGYKEVELAQSTTGSQKAKELIDVTQIKTTAKSRKHTKKSNLDLAIQNFVRQIYEEAGNKLSHFVKGDINGDGVSPLGKLSVKQIEKGRYILQELANLIAVKSRITISDVINLSNEYYANIPKVFGSRVTPDMVAIMNTHRISEEMDILKFYEDSLMMGGVLFATDEIDKQYDSLHSDIGILLPSTDKYRKIENYVRNTESNHHNVHLNVKQIFTVKQKNAPTFDSSPGNVKELFHGTRSANMIGILPTNLKLPQQLTNVVITGAMYGPGLYFADQSTKSSQYSCSRFGGTTNKYKTAFMFLAEVALGRVKKEETSHYYLSAPKGYDSVMGVKGRSLLHNEFITYRENQHELKYIIEFEPKSQY